MAPINNLFKHLLTHAGQTIWETRLLRSLHQSSKQHIGQVFFINNTFSSTGKLLTPNMYFWSCHQTLDASQSG